MNSNVRDPNLELDTYLINERKTIWKVINLILAKQNIEQGQKIVNGIYHDEVNALLIKEKQDIENTRGLTFCIPFILHFCTFLVGLITTLVFLYVL